MEADLEGCLLLFLLIIIMSLDVAGIGRVYSEVQH